MLAEIAQAIRGGDSGNGDLAASLATLDHSQTIPHNTHTLVQYNDVVFNFGGCYNATLQRFTATEPGIYLATVNLLLTSADWLEGEAATLSLYKNNSLVYYLDRFQAQSDTTMYVRVFGSVPIWLETGNWINVFIHQNTGVSVNVHPSEKYNWFSVVQPAAPPNWVI
jgi:hypothetical protein